jgi:large subunit ribosomal protein L10
MLRSEKEQVVERLTERIRTAETLIVADYRGLTNAQMEGLRDELLKHGARFSVVKNTLTRRAAEAAGNEALLALLEGPTGIAFLETGADPVATAKALSQLARDTRVLAIRGGILEGKPVSTEEVESLATLPPADVLRGQVLGAIVGPIQSFAGLIAAPLTDFVGLIAARIEQLGGEGEEVEPAAEPEPEPPAAAEQPEPIEEVSPEAPAAEPAGEAEEETTPGEEAPASETDTSETEKKEE